MQTTARTPPYAYFLPHEISGEMSVHPQSLIPTMVNKDKQATTAKHCKFRNDANQKHTNECNGKTL